MTKHESFHRWRRFPIGAEPMSEGETHFRIWAPQHKKVEVILKADVDSRAIYRFVLESEGNGYFSKVIDNTRPGMYYQIGLGQHAFPDPASRFQPNGPHGPSEIIDPNAFEWTDQHWKGLELEGQVIYECHIGTFTEKGNWKAASEQLPELKELGITIIEVLPVADFVGRFGWGYDGVNLFSPTRLYGRPEDFKAFVNCAHALGLGVILDVVYNHMGPEGNYLKEFSQDYFSKHHATDWGEAINFDDHNSGPVREYFISNAKYWITEFHLDGLRLDAIQDIYDASKKHIIADISENAHQSSPDRKILLVAENEPQTTRLLKPIGQGGYGINGVWNDDFHHSAIVAMTGRAEAYYSQHQGRAQEFVSAVKYSYLYQGQIYQWQGKRRGNSTKGLKPWRFIHYLDNHDQVANSGRGYRCHMQTSPGRYRAMTALFLLSPQTPMIFQGQEFASSSRFYYFADHREELAQLIEKGRSKFLSQFRSLATIEMRDYLPDPADPGTFTSSKLNFLDREKNIEIYKMHKDLLRLRREDPVFSLQGKQGLDGAVLAEEAFVLRYFGTDEDDRLLIVNLGLDLHFSPAPEPLLAPPIANEWQTLWSSENPNYGGRGTAKLETDNNWLIPGNAAIVLRPVSDSEVNT